MQQIETSWLKQVRDRLLQLQLSPYYLAQSIAIPEASIRCFLRGGTIKSVHFQTLAEYLGFQLTPPNHHI